MSDDQKAYRLKILLKPSDDNERQRLKDSCGDMNISFRTNPTQKSIRIKSSPVLYPNTCPNSCATCQYERGNGTVLLISGRAYNSNVYLKPENTRAESYDSHDSANGIFLENKDIATRIFLDNKKGFRV